MSTVQSELTPTQQFVALAIARPEAGYAQALRESGLADQMRSILTAYQTDRVYFSLPAYDEHDIGKPGNRSGRHCFELAEVRQNVDGVDDGPPVGFAFSQFHERARGTLILCTAPRYAELEDSAGVFVDSAPKPDRFIRDLTHASGNRRERSLSALETSFHLLACLSEVLQTKPTALLDAKGRKEVLIP